jgi:hypothetical protein
MLLHDLGITKNLLISSALRIAVITASSGIVFAALKGSRS